MSIRIEHVVKSFSAYPALDDVTLVVDPSSKVRIQAGLPNTILIDKDGNVAYQQGVEIKSVDQLKQLVADHLGVHL